MSRFKDESNAILLYVQSEKVKWAATVVKQLRARKEEKLRKLVKEHAAAASKLKSELDITTSVVAAQAVDWMVILSSAVTASLIEAEKSIESDNAPVAAEASKKMKELE